MTTKAIPDRYNGLMPSLVVSQGVEAIRFYQQVFGATELMRLNYPGSTKIAHAELMIRNHILMLGDECPEMGVRAPAGTSLPPYSIMIYVEDVDATFKLALSLGARSVMAPEDMFWGDRYAKFIDPFGHQWGVATHQKEVSPEECARAMVEWGKEKAGA